MITGAIYIGIGMGLNYIVETPDVRSKLLIRWLEVKAAYKEGVRQREEDK